MVLVDHTGWKLRRKQWTGTTDQLIEDLEAAYDNAPNMFSIRIHHGGKFQRSLTSLDEGLYALACEEDVHCLATFGVDTQCHVLSTIQSQFSDINLSFVSQQATAGQVIDDVMRQLSFKDTELDGEAGFADVAGSGVDSSGLIKTQSELPVSEEPDVGRTQEPILAEVSTQEPIVAEVSTQELIVAESSEDAGTDDDDVDEDFLVDEENEIVEPDVNVHLFGISMDLPFDNIGVTNLVPNDVLEGEDMDVINADGFDTNPVVNRSTPKEAKDRVYLHSIESKRNLKLYKNDSVRIIARCDGKVPVFTMLQGTNYDNQASSSVLDAHDKEDLCLWVLKIKHCTYKFLSEKIFEQVIVNPDIPFKAVQDQLQCELEVQISMSKAFRAKAKAEREIRGNHVLQYSMLRDYVVELQSTNPNTTVKIAVERNTDHSLPTRVFQRIYVYLGALKLGFRACRKDLLGLDGAFMKGPFSSQVLVAVGLDSNNGIYPLTYVLVEAESRAKSDLLLNNTCEAFNGKIVGGRDKPVITLLEYIMEYCMKRFVNVQGVIGKCTGPLTPTATRIMESIKKEAHLMKVQWNRANKYQVSGSLGDQCVVDVVRKKEPLHANHAETMDTIRQHAKDKVEMQQQASTKTEPAVSQDATGGSGVGAVIGLSAVAGEGGAGGPGGAGVYSQSSSHSRWTKRRVQIERISPQKRTPTQPASQPSTSSQVPVSETRNAYGREMGDGVPTQSSAAGGASEWAFL
ncbi:hypothetical protein Tco_0111227 [Tanacetum coccineum]